MAVTLQRILGVAWIVFLTDAVATRDLGNQVAAGTASRSIDDVATDFLGYPCSGSSVKDYMYYMCGKKECGENRTPEEITDICVRVREDGNPACVNANSALWTGLQDGESKTHTFEFGTFAYWNPSKGGPVETALQFLDSVTEAKQRAIWLSGVPLVANGTLKAASARCLVTMTKAQKMPENATHSLSYIKATTCADIIWTKPKSTMNELGEGEPGDIVEMKATVCGQMKLTDPAAPELDLGDQLAAGTASRSIDDVATDFLGYPCSGSSVKDYMYYMCGTKECGENRTPEEITDICVRVREDGKTACMNANSALWTGLQDGESKTHTFEFGKFAYWNPSKGSPVTTTQFLDSVTEAKQRAIWLSGVPLVANGTLKAASARCLVTMTKAQKMPLKYRKTKNGKKTREYRANLSYFKATTCADMIWTHPLDGRNETKATVCGEMKRISMSDYTVNHKAIRDQKRQGYVSQNFKVFAAQLV